MSITQTSCPNCGSPVTPGSQCPECGTWVSSEEAIGLEAGEVYAFQWGNGAGADGATAYIEAVSLWLGMKDRRVFWAKLDRVEGDESRLPKLEGWLLLEESQRSFGSGIGPGRDDRLPSSVRRREPLVTSNESGRPVRLYRNDGGLSLEEIVELADRELDLFQIAVIFDQVLEGIEQLHEAGLVHLSITPQTIRLGGAETPGGIPGTLAPPDAEPAEAHGFEDEGGDTDGNFPAIDLDGSATPLQAADARFKPDETTSPHAKPLGLEEETEEDYTPPSEFVGDEGTQPVDEEAEGEGGDAADAPDEAGDELPAWAWLGELGFSLPGLEDFDHRSLRGGNSVETRLLFDGGAGIWPRDERPRNPQEVDGYSPPEFYGRSPEEADHTADVFELGMLLYYLLTGRKPPASVYTRHTPAIPARNFRPDFPPGLGPVLKRATRPDPQMRYPDVAALRTAFTEAVEVIMERSFASRDAPPRLKASVDRHAGIAKRQRNPINQDNVFEETSQDRQFSLVVVADGVSTASYGSGEIASRMTIEVAESVWERILPKYLMGEEFSEIEIVEEILERANQRIVDYVNQRHTPFTGSAHEVMGTTALVSIFNDGVVTLGAVGDSRAYLQRGSGLEQLTIDHNLWTLGILEGLPADDSLSMPRGDALARCLGTFTIHDGMLEPAEPGADIFQFRVAQGDTLLLTTDGLVDFAGGNIFAAEENILATLLSEPEPALACLELILLANRGGGGDNIGIGIARFSQ